MYSGWHLPGFWIRLNTPTEVLLQAAQHALCGYWLGQPHLIRNAKLFPPLLNLLQCRPPPQLAPPGLPDADTTGLYNPFSIAFKIVPPLL